MPFGCSTVCLMRADGSEDGELFGQVSARLPRPVLKTALAPRQRIFGDPGPVDPAVTQMHLARLNRQYRQADRYQ